MHQTTVRFGGDLWGALDLEAERLGVSIAQYVRDAALSRLSYDAGRRAEFVGPARQVSSAMAAQDVARDETSQSEALWAQGRLARKHAVDLRERSEQLRATRVDRKT
ncbi:MAG TPA: hypothetical protein VGF21_09860 [Thermoleophilaceae bacterium]|jgi:hypothetical protein